jgi:signal transduction histidine kinase
MTAATRRLLVVDDEESVLETIAAILQQEGYEVVAAGAIAAALDNLQKQPFDLVLTDLRVEEDSGLTLVAELQRQWPDTMSVVLTGYASLESAIDALRKGAYDYLIKPCNVEELKLTVARAVERGALARALRERLEELNAANAKLLSFSEQLQERVDQATSDLTQKIEELDEAKRGLEEVHHQREELISMIAHDLSGPLTTIGAYAQLLGQENVRPETQEKARRTILSETRRLGRLVQDLADASHLALGGFRVQPGACDLAELVREQVDLARITTDQHTFRVDAPPQAVPTMCDRDRVAQVLSNLLGNAIKYTPGGEIRVSLRVDEGRAVLAVGDQGPGIPPERLEAIFEPGVRLGGSAARGKPKGSGLGLYIARGIVAAHGGQIWAESTAGHGATFTVSLPLVAIAQPASEAKVG